MTTESTLRAALPCPFCGESEAVAERDQANFPQTQCLNCGARGPCTQLDDKTGLVQWNARAALSAQEPYPPLPTEWMVVSDVEGQPVKVYRAFQLRDYVDADRAARPESVDARRYRWLRDSWWLDPESEKTPDPMTHANTPAEFDEAIDAAIAKGEQTT